MARKKKKQERPNPEEIIEEQSEEAKAAAEKHEKVQQEAMADLLDDAPGAEVAPAQPEGAEQQPPEKPAEAEPKSQPKDAEDPEAEKPAKEEEQPPAEQPEAKAEVPESKPEEKPPEESPKESEFVSGDQFGNYTVEVVSDDGAKVVPLGNLVTTYHQFGHLQRKYQEVKPLFDLAEKAKVNVADTLPLLELGINTYLKQQGIVEGRRPPIAETKPMAPAATGDYQGPFKDAEQDAYYLEVDPDHHAAMHRMFEMIQGGGKVAQLEQEIENLKHASTQPPPADPAATEQAQQQAQEAFDKKILAWSGDHTDYFTAENIGEARLDAFKNFIIRNHAKSGLKIKDLNNDFLAAEFARFDPRYNLEYMKRLASQKAVDGKQDSGMFAEGSGARAQAEPLDEQQKHMADLL